MQKVPDSGESSGVAPPNVGRWSCGTTWPTEKPRPLCAVVIQDTARCQSKLIARAPIGIQTPGAAAGTASQTSNRWDGVQQWQELDDVMAVATGVRDDERGAMAVDDQMVLGAGTGTVDGRGADAIPPSRART
ncbi:hypothetical protein GCM10023336_52020 [Streptomyces similanensis]|uniref:Transposase n=1 Tax=Streptomyces similanensis TaxID=1274988 RepID=A0ABP9L0X1_9ACTN